MSYTPVKDRPIKRNDIVKIHDVERSDFESSREYLKALRKKGQDARVKSVDGERVTVKFFGPGHYITTSKKNLEKVEDA